MQKTLIGILTVFFLSSFCLNLYHVNASGQEFDGLHLSTLPIFYQSFDTTFYKRLIEKIDKGDVITYKNKSHALSDKSVALMKLGKVKDAQKILLNLYEKTPDEYNIVINLATSYELTGNVDSALILTKKALQINESSHRGSEWFHVKVLEAKQKMKDNSNWIKENKVLDIRLPEFEPDSIMELDTIQEIIEDIGYQLVERVPFTPQHDILLANIFNEYGDILSRISIEMAYVAYGIGEKYDKGNTFELTSKKVRMLSLIEKHDLKIPDIDDFYPDENEFGSERMEMGPRIHRDTLNDPIFETIDRVRSIVTVLMSLLFAFLVYRLYKKYFS